MPSGKDTRKSGRGRGDMKNWLGLINIYNTGEGGRISQTLSSSVRTGGACVFLAPKIKKGISPWAPWCIYCPCRQEPRGRPSFGTLWNSGRHKRLASVTNQCSSRASLSLSLVCVFNIRATLFPFAETRQSHATGVSQVHNFDTLSLAKVFFSFLDSGQSRTFFLFFFSFLIGRPIGKVENKKRRQKKMIFLSFVVWPTISASHVDIFDCEFE